MEQNEQKKLEFRVGTDLGLYYLLIFGFNTETPSLIPTNMSPSPPITVTLTEVHKVLSSRPLRSTTFSFVLFTSFAKAFLAGIMPQYFPLYLVLLYPLMLACVVRSWRRKRWLLYFAEFCWYFNCSFWLLVLPHEILASGGVIVPLVSPGTRLNLGRAFFIISCGPVAITNFINKTSYVMHDVAKTSGFFIHFTPCVLCWVLRWRETAYAGHDWSPHDLAGSFFAHDLHKGQQPPPTAADLVSQASKVYALWWAVYSAWLLYRGCELPGEGYASSFDDITKKLPKSWPLRARALTYVAGHFVVVHAMFAAAVLVYRSFVAHTVFCFVLLAYSVNQGAKYYHFAYGGERVRRELEKLVREKEGKKE